MQYCCKYNRVHSGEKNFPVSMFISLQGEGSSEKGKVKGRYARNLLTGEYVKTPRLKIC